jgi:hypothetical protein
MKKLTIVFTLALMLLAPSIKLLSSDIPVPSKKVFTIEAIKKLADAYVNNNLGLKNPAIVDVDGDGIFDILIFKDGNIEYYRNTGTQEKPFFVPENMHYDKYASVSFLTIALPYPVFFADKNGDGSPDMFVIKDKIYDSKLQQNDYKILYSENVLGLDTGVLITIVLVLLIIVLLLAIL